MSTPYYRDDQVTLYHGDAILVPEWLTADNLITDPPYGVAYQSNMVKGREKNPIAGDEDTVTRDRALELWGTTKPALVFGHWKVPKPAATRQTGIWDKGDSPGMGDLTMPFGPSFEEFYLLGGPWVGKRGSAIVRSNTLPPGNRPDHPTPKPVALMERLISHTVGTIADPFAGSGPTLIAARNLGRTAIGVEFEERYCEMIATRLQQQAFDFGDWDGA